MGIFGFDSLKDMFDGGGKGGSGSEYSSENHEDYLIQFEEKNGVKDDNARSHSGSDDMCYPQNLDPLGSGLITNR